MCCAVVEYKNMPFSHAKHISPDFLEATGIFLMQTGSIETMREQRRGVRLFTPSRPLR
jgi:hypothetical protein